MRSEVTQTVDTDTNQFFPCKSNLKFTSLRRFFLFLFFILTYSALHSRSSFATCDPNQVNPPPTAEAGTFSNPIILPAAVQLKDAAKIQSGSKEPNRNKVGKVSWTQVEEIAKDKMSDLNAFTLDSAMKMVAGTARSMGLTVEGNAPWEK